MNTFLKKLFCQLTSQIWLSRVDFYWQNLFPPGQLIKTGKMFFTRFLDAKIKYLSRRFC